MLGDSAFVDRNQKTALLMWNEDQGSLLNDLVWSLAALCEFGRDAKQYWAKVEARNVIQATQNKVSEETFSVILAMFSEEINESTFKFVRTGHTINRIVFPKAIFYLSNKYNNAGESEMKAFFYNTIDQKALYFIANYQGNGLREEDDFEKYAKVNFDQFLAKLLNSLSYIRNELDFSKQEEKIDLIDDPSADLAMRLTLALRFTLWLVRTAVADGNPEFRDSFCVNNGLKGLLKLLDDANFLDRNLNTKLVMFGDSKIPFLDILIKCLAELSKYCDDVKQCWRELDVINLIKSLLHKLPGTAFYCLTVITNLADDSHIEKLQEIGIFKGMLIERLKVISEQYESANVRTNWLTVYENKMRVHTQFVYFTEANGGETSLYDILNSLYKLALNENMKVELYFDLNCKIYIKSILKAIENAPHLGSPGRYEQKYALR
jgi:hypothetical protein